jgi:hypothetical protein
MIGRQACSGMYSGASTGSRNLAYVYQRRMNVGICHIHCHRQRTLQDCRRYYSDPLVKSRAVRPPGRPLLWHASFDFVLSGLLTFVFITCGMLRSTSFYGDCRLDSTAPQRLFCAPRSIWQSCLAIRRAFLRATPLVSPHGPAHPPLVRGLRGRVHVQPLWQCKARFEHARWESARRAAAHRLNSPLEALLHTTPRPRFKSCMI